MYVLAGKPRADGSTKGIVQIAIAMGLILRSERSGGCRSSHSLATKLHFLRVPTSHVRVRVTYLCGWRSFSNDRLSRSSVCMFYVGFVPT
jgi:hypothetical protein